MLFLHYNCMHIIPVNVSITVRGRFIIPKITSRLRLMNHLLLYYKNLTQTRKHNMSYDSAKQ